MKLSRVAVLWLLAALGLLIAAVLLLIWPGWGYQWTWTGFGPNTSLITRTHIALDQPTKTLWDWLQLLIVPLMLAGLAAWFNLRDRAREQRQHNSEQAIADYHREVELQLTKERQREARLEAYLDRMSALLLDNGLHDSKEETDEVRNIARAYTITVLRGLDRNRKGVLVQFLYESGLINAGADIVFLHKADLTMANLESTWLKDGSLIRVNLADADISESWWVGADLTQADLRRANLRGTNLSKVVLCNAYMRGANLTGVDLSEANLREAHLPEVDLTDADLSGADLSDANLEGAKVTSEQLAQAKSLKGAILPDGSKQA